MRMGSKKGGTTRRSSNDNISVKKRSRYLNPTDVVDLEDIEFLRRFVTEFGKIIPARLTGVTAHQQRQISKGVARARNMGLLA